MNNEGYILANELNKIRYERLKHNVETQGATIVEVSNCRGEKIGDIYNGYFDKVLLDTPCSGEGRFIAKTASTYRDWSEKTVNNLTKIQKKLLESAYKALKPNGSLVYSTCTLNKKENEYILDWAINNLNVKLENINIDINDALPAFNDNLDKSINKAIRILPSKNMEGFFIAKFIKL